MAKIELHPEKSLTLYILFVFEDLTEKYENLALS
jgi:hypothetical protein